MSSCCDELLFKITNYTEKSLTLDLVELGTTDILCSGLLERKGFTQVWTKDINLGGKYIGAFIIEVIVDSKKYYLGGGLTNFYSFEGEYFIVLLRGQLTGDNTEKIVSFSWEGEETNDFTKKPTNKLIFNGV